MEVRKLATIHLPADPALVVRVLQAILDEEPGAVVLESTSYMAELVIGLPPPAEPETQPPLALTDAS